MHKGSTGKEVWWIQMFRKKSDIIIGLEIRVKVSVFAKGRICMSRDADSGKMGTGTSLNRVGYGEQHHRGPLIKFLLDVAHYKKSCCGLQSSKI
jgi:hypothetical protein